MRLLIAALALLAAPAWAVDHAALAERALDRHILPRFDALAAETAALAAATKGVCPGPEATAAYGRAFDAWSAVSHLRFGPLEEGETGFAIAYWPDPRGATPKALAALEAAEDPVVDDPAAFAQWSVAARGLFALDALLGAQPVEGYDCRLVAAVARDLAATAAGAAARWRDPYAGYLRSAGAAGNPLFLTPDEATRALYGAMLTGLEFTADLRFGRPLGAFNAPQPRRAEAWRTGRSQRNARLAIEAVQDLYLAAFAPELSEAARGRIADVFAEALVAADNAGQIEVEVISVGGRLRVEAAQQAVRFVSDQLELEIAPALGIAAGFNSMDGD